MIHSKETGVYKITNLINDKIYIGSSSSVKDGFSDRIRTHIRLLNNKTHYNKHLQASWDKYGSNNFIFEIVEVVLDCNKIIEREQYYIDTLNCCDPKIGYNKAKIAGSQLGFKFSDESKKKMSISWYKNEKENRERFRLTMLGRIQTEEEKNKKSKALLGIKRSDEFKEKMRIISKNRIMSKESIDKMIKTKTGVPSEKRKRVHQLDLNNDIIKTWDSVTEASKSLKIYNISNVCNGKQISAGGYKWKYEI